MVREFYSFCRLSVFSTTDSHTFVFAELKAAVQIRAKTLRLDIFGEVPNSSGFIAAFSAHDDCFVIAPECGGRNTPRTIFHSENVVSCSDLYETDIVPANCEEFAVGAERATSDLPEGKLDCGDFSPGVNVPEPQITMKITCVVRVRGARGFTCEDFTIGTEGQGGRAFVVSVLFCILCFRLPVAMSQTLRYLPSFDTNVFPSRLKSISS